MDLTFVLDVVSRITHVLTAIVLLGGSMFTVWVLSPASSVLDQSQRDALQERVVSRWRWYVHLGITLFLASGFYNFIRALPQHQGDGLYHALVGTKILLALVVFFIAAALVGRSQALQTIRDRRVAWTRALVLIACVIVAISGYVKVRGNPNAESNGPGGVPEPQVPVAARMQPDGA